jgi:hypothetical protein
MQAGLLVVAPKAWQQIRAISPRPEPVSGGRPVSGPWIELRSEQVDPQGDVRPWLLAPNGSQYERKEH